MRKADQGFKKSERIKERESFKRLFKSGSYFKSGNFSLRILPNSRGITRLGISVKKELLPEAVQRNRLKRLVREVFRKNKGCLAKGYEVLVRPKDKKVLMIQYRGIEKELLELFKAAGIVVS